MRLNQALDNEKQRQEPQNWNKIFLHKDGKFLHAYEWSAWLTKTLVCTEDMQRERGDKSFLSAFRLDKWRISPTAITFENSDPPIEHSCKQVINTIYSYAFPTSSIFIKPLFDVHTQSPYWEMLTNGDVCIAYLLPFSMTSK